MTNYYSADLHFNHANIIKFSNRPFTTVEEMNEELIRRHNKVVKPNDTWYCLGDFAFSKNPDKFLSRLNGRKHLIIGNHDAEQTTKSQLWESVQPYLEVNDNKVKIVLCHYPFKTWNRSHYGSINLHGHCHGSLEGTSQSLDVGVDCWDYKPVQLSEILEKLKINKLYKSEDHHQSK